MLQNVIKPLSMKTSKKVFMPVLFASISFFSYGQWASLSPATTGNFRDIFAVNELIVYAVGENALVMKTTDGGTNWQTQAVPVSTHLNSVFFLNSTEGFAVGEGGVILSTSNGGSSWSLRSTGTSLHINDISFFNSSVGVAVGDNGLVLRTVNGGSSWTSISSPTIFILHAVKFITDSTGYAAGASGVILKTTDAGQSWTLQNSSSTQSFYGMDFIDEMRGVVVGTNRTIRKTSDGGITWNNISGNTVPNEWYRDVEYMLPGIIFAAGSNGTVIRSFADTMWSALSTGVTDGLLGLSVVNMNTGYAAGAGGAVIKTSNGGGNAVSELSPPRIAFSVSPNPFTSFAEISYCLEKPVVIEIDAFNMLGEQSCVLHPSRQDSGKYKVEFGDASLPPGIYTLRFTAGGRSSAVKLVKLQ